MSPSEKNIHFHINRNLSPYDMSPNELYSYQSPFWYEILRRWQVWILHTKPPYSDICHHMVARYEKFSYLSPKKPFRWWRSDRFYHRGLCLVLCLPQWSLSQSALCLWAACAPRCCTGYCPPWQPSWSRWQRRRHFPAPYILGTRIFLSLYSAQRAFSWWMKKRNGGGTWTLWSLNTWLIHKVDTWLSSCLFWIQNGLLGIFSCWDIQGV